MNKDHPLHAKDLTVGVNLNKGFTIMACKSQYVFFITTSLLLLISSPTRICSAANQGNPHGSPISIQTLRPGNDINVTISQTGLRVMVPSATQGPDSTQSNDIWSEHLASSFDAPVPVLPDFLSRSIAAPQGARRIWDEGATDSASSHLKPPVPPASRVDVPTRLLSHGASYAQQIHWPRFLFAPIPHEETSPLLLNAATNLNPDNRLIAKSLPGTRIDTEGEFSPSPWMYSIALIGFVVYTRRRGSV